MDEDDVDRKGNPRQHRARFRGPGNTSNWNKWLLDNGIGFIMHPGPGINFNFLLFDYFYPMWFFSW